MGGQRGSCAAALLPHSPTWSACDGAVRQRRLNVATHSTAQANAGWTLFFPSGMACHRRWIKCSLRPRWSRRCEERKKERKNTPWAWVEGASWVLSPEGTSRPPWWSRRCAAGAGTLLLRRLACLPALPCSANHHGIARRHIPYLLCSHFPQVLCDLVMINQAYVGDSRTQVRHLLLSALLCVRCLQGSHALCTPGRHAAVQVASAMHSKLSPARHTLHPFRSEARAPPVSRLIRNRRWSSCWLTAPALLTSIRPRLTTGR